VAELAPILYAVIAAVAYVVAARRGEPVPAVVVALAPPLDGRAVTSLTAHMVQHVLLLVVAPPLLVAGDPRVLLRLTSWARLKDRRVNGPGAGLGAAAVAVVVQTTAMWGWHAPRFYEAADRHLLVHVVEHLSFLGVGLLFWWVVLRPGRGPQPGAAAILFVAALPGVALGAALTLAGAAWYPSYADLGDQQLAGVVMWAFGGAVYVVAAFVAFARWLASEGDAVPAPRALEVRG
jgi:putative membrane protein